MRDGTELPRARGSVLVVDDDPVSRRILTHLLTQEGHDLTLAENGARAVEALSERSFDLVVLDIRMPELDGYEVCRRIRHNPITQALPVIMITAEGAEKLPALEAGADDFLTKPFDREELLARVRSLLRIKRYHDTIEAQRSELEAWTRTLEERVRDQVREIERLSTLRRFLAPQVANLLLSSDDREFLKPHRRLVVVCFADLRRFTAFTESIEPEELIRVLDEFYGAVGAVIAESHATVGYLGGDSVMAYLNDPLPCPEPEKDGATMALKIRTAMSPVIARWRRLGYDMDVGIGLASGYATLGVAGFEGRFEYSPLGTVVNLAARLCGEAAPGQILLSRRLCAAIEEDFETEPLGDVPLNGFHRPVPIASLVGSRRNAAVETVAAEEIRT